MISHRERYYEDGVPYSFQLTIDHLLRTGARFAPDQEIVYRDLVRLDYRGLCERVSRLAQALAALGVQQGDTVAILDWDSHRYLECFFAIPMLGATLHTVNVRLSPDQILYTMNHAEDQVVLVNAEFLPLLEPMAKRLETVRKYVLLTDSGEQPATSLHLEAEYEEMLQKAAGRFRFPQLDENTQATVFYTTGTTGLPKGVRFTHRQLVLQTLAEAAAFGSYVSPGRLRSDDVYMPLTPMFHVHAWGVPYLATMLGIKQVYPGRYEPAMLMKLITKEEVTFSHCVPTILQMIANNPAASQVDLSNWKVVIGGAPLSKGLAQAALRLGIQTYSGYGMSESCPLISVANLKPTMLKWDSERQLDVQTRAGLPPPLVDVKLVDLAGEDVPLDGKSTGELVVRAPWLTREYYKEPGRSKELWRRGWLHTGDVAYIDSHGYIHITDRIKDVIKSGGEWISSVAMEDMLSQLEGVSEAAVIGVPDEKWGERPVALLVLKAGYSGRVTAEDVKAYLTQLSEQGRLARWAVPERVEFLDALPKTSVGKIAKRELRAQFRR